MSWYRHKLIGNDSKTNQVMSNSGLVTSKTNRESQLLRQTFQKPDRKREKPIRVFKYPVGEGFYRRRKYQLTGWQQSMCDRESQQ
jgi:hypothetical protein